MVEYFREDYRVLLQELTIGKLYKIKDYTRSSSAQNFKNIPNLKCKKKLLLIIQLFTYFN